MNSFSSTKNKIDPGKILGGILGSFDETEYEKETSLVSSVKDFFGGVYEATADLGQTVIIAESKTETNGQVNFSKNGSIEFNKPNEDQKKQAEIKRKTLFFQTLKQDQEKAQREQEQALEQEITDMVAHLPTEQKNELLSLQADYRNNNSIYHRAELRRKIIEQRRKADQQQKAASIPSPAKQPSALEGAFEGGSGKQGSGTANLSAQAVG